MLLALTSIGLCLAPEGAAKTRRWGEYTKAFDEEIRFGPEEEIVEVDLPEALVRAGARLTLVVEHNGLGGSNVYRWLKLLVNEQDAGDGYRYGPGKTYTSDPVTIEIDPKDLKPGTNRLRFSISRNLVGGSSAIYKLRFELPDELKNDSRLAGAAPASKREETPRQAEPAEKAAQPQSPPAAAPKMQADRPVKAAEARWALVVGVSEYRDSRIPALRYAASDADAFYRWLVSPSGGKYAPARVRLLTNRQATAQNIKDALFVWLGQAIEEDIVTLYFACHGSPQSPDTPENLFLLPYDVRYDSIATTGFPMWDIETALKRFIKARKVIVIADACHAGGVGQEFDAARRDARGLKAVPISSNLQNLSQIGDGICIITASADDQFSQESSKWGGGHGVFTHFLLQGLEGNADYNRDRIVSLGEIIPYLSEQVRRETRNAQSPTVSGRFDPALAIGK